jgi:hypothetical protein
MPRVRFSQLVTSHSAMGTLTTFDRTQEGLVDQHFHTFNGRYGSGRPLLLAVDFSVT